MNSLYRVLIELLLRRRSPTSTAEIPVEDTATEIDPRQKKLDAWLQRKETEENEQARKNRLLAVRTEPERYWTRASNIWAALLITIPIDGFLALVEFPFEEPLMLAKLLEHVAILLGLIALFSTNTEALTNVASNIRKLQGRFAGSKLGSVLTIVFVVLATFSEILLKITEIGLLPLILLTTAILAGVPSILESLSQQKANQQDQERDGILWLESANAQLFYMLLAPIFCARLISFLGAARASISATPEWTFLLYASSSVVLLLALRPQREDYLAPCLRCRHIASRVLQDRESCTVCARDEFLHLPNIDDYLVNLNQTEVEIEEAQEPEVEDPAKELKKRLQRLLQSDELEAS